MQAEARLRLLRLTGGDDLFEPVGDGFEFGRVRRWWRLWASRPAAAASLLGQVGQARFERIDARLKALRIEFVRSRSR